MKKFLAFFGLVLALTGSQFISDLSHRSFKGLVIGLSIMLGGMLFGKFGLETK